MGKAIKELELADSSHFISLSVGGWLLKPPAGDWITKWGSLTAMTASTWLAPTFGLKFRNTGPAYVLPDVSSEDTVCFNYQR